MNYSATCKGDEARIKVEEARPGVYRVRIDGEDLEVDFFNTRENIYSLIIGQQSYEVDINAEEEGNYAVQLNGNRFDVDITDERKRKLAEKMAAGNSGRQEIKSPMAGNIWKVLKQQGDRVEEGEVLLILEAMKMENEICAPATGVVTSMNAVEGSAVSAGALLCQLDQPED